MKHNVTHHSHIYSGPQEDVKRKPTLEEVERDDLDDGENSQDYMDSYNPYAFRTDYFLYKNTSNQQHLIPEKHHKSVKIETPGGGSSSTTPLIDRQVTSELTMTKLMN